MSRPTFLVVGGQKCGTTWLEKNLGLHPEVATPQAKELHFFDKAAVFARGPAWYEDQFPDGPGIRARGEFTPNYFWIPSDAAEAAESGQLDDIPDRIHELYPDLRLIVILRDPVERAVSAYYHHIRARRIRPEQRISEVWNRLGIRSMGEYGRILSAWLTCFSKEQFKVLLYETAVMEFPVSAIQDCYRFIGVNDSVTPDGLNRIQNPGDSFFLLRMNHRLPGLARLVRKVNPKFGQRWKRFEIPVDALERQELRDYYRDDSRALADLLGIQLPWQI